VFRLRYVYSTLHANIVTRSQRHVSETVFILSLSKRVEERKHSKKEEEFFVVSSNKVAYVAQDKAGKKILNVRVHPNKAMEDYITRWRRTDLFNLYRQVVL